MWSKYSEMGKLLTYSHNTEQIYKQYEANKAMLHSSGVSIHANST